MSVDVVRPGAARHSALPDLAVSVIDGAVESHAAVPTLRFTLEVESRYRVPIRTAMLVAQIRIAAPRRGYDRDEQSRLAELFGGVERWGTTLRSLYWTHATFVLPPFDDRTGAALLVPCTYDFDVVAAKYLHAVQDGHIPLDFLFSGSLFYLDDEGLLKTSRVSWELESAYRLPVKVWKELIDQYFPQSAWLRLRRDTFDQLYSFKAERAITTWEEAIDFLLRTAKPGKA
ncbi:MAG TPA: DUF6084 family protein [Gemmatimonadaceae bacterium]|jgi:hypothetical protein